MNLETWKIWEPWYNEEEWPHELYWNITTNTLRRECFILNYDPYWIPENIDNTDNTKNTEKQEDEKDFLEIF